MTSKTRRSDRNTIRAIASFVARGRTNVRTTLRLTRTTRYAPTASAASSKNPISVCSAAVRRTPSEHPHGLDEDRHMDRQEQVPVGVAGEPVRHEVGGLDQSR